MPGGVGGRGALLTSRPTAATSTPLSSLPPAPTSSCPNTPISRAVVPTRVPPALCCCWFYFLSRFLSSGLCCAVLGRQGGSPEEQQHLRKLFEGCGRKRCLPWPAFPIAPAAQCLGAKAFLHHHGSSPPTLIILLLKEWPWLHTHDALPAISSVSHGDSTLVHPKSQDGAKPSSMTSSPLPHCCHRDSCSQHWCFLPGDCHCLHQPSLFLASWCWLE